MFTGKLKSWKTTICGIFTLAFAIILFIIERPIEGGLATTVGIGLLSAKDSDVTGTGTETMSANEIQKLKEDCKEKIK